LIRRLNDALGTTSVVVTHDIQESVKIIDYIYLTAKGEIVAQGSPQELMDSSDPFVHQFFHGEPDGPLPFHYPGQSYAQDLGLTISHG
jgi:phospholipid/cholesterol/gamma-HCH transport system ATP-binding protein